MAAEAKDIDAERQLAAAARALAADAFDGQALVALLGADEASIRALLAETVLAWRNYLSELEQRNARRPS